MAAYKDQLFIAYTDVCNSLNVRNFDGHHLTIPFELSKSCHGDLSLAANDSQLLLSYIGDNQQLVIMSFDLENGWQDSQSPVSMPVSQASIVAIPNQNSFLMAYQDTSGDVYSACLKNGQWDNNTAKLCCNCQGKFELAALGATILLIYKVAGSEGMACLSYNTADFNVTNVAQSAYAGPYDDATVNTWSPCAFSINSFSYGPSVITPDEPEPVVESFKANGHLATATLDGVVHLLHNAPNSNQLVTETFSISGTLTPKNPVSYDPSQEDTTSNGYGTMYEAGWSQQQAVNGVIREPDSAIAAGRLNNQLWLFYQPLGSEGIKVCRGGYD